MHCSSVCLSPDHVGFWTSFNRIFTACADPDFTGRSPITFAKVRTTPRQRWIATDGAISDAE
jgi:hypothetical protein